jgi:hypothetical protein
MAVDDHEWSGLERRLEGSVVDELGPGQPTKPLPWPIPRHVAKIHYDDLVGGLCLAV